MKHHRVLGTYLLLVMGNAAGSAPDDSRREPLSPLPEIKAADPRIVELGRQLFTSTLLSEDKTISCASCHHLSLNGADTKPLSNGVRDLPGTVNSPTVFNAVFNFRQFWDGRASSLEEQIDGPLQNPNEMGSTWSQVLQRLNADDHFRSQFLNVFNESATAQNVKKAIADFERSLVTPNSKMDRYLKGDLNALSRDEKKGYETFKTLGCVSCHQGANVGGNMYQVFGVMGDFFRDRGSSTKADLGRFNVTGKSTDRHVFKVPSLRNVAVTPPYFHDGSVQTLEEAVRIMGKYQIGRDLTAKEIESLVLFLKTLTGSYNGRSL